MSPEVCLQPPSVWCLGYRKPSFCLAPQESSLGDFEPQGPGSVVECLRWSRKDQQKWDLGC